MKLRHRYRQLLVSVMVVPLLLVTSCAGGGDEQASKSTAPTQQDSAEADTNGAEPDTNDADSQIDEQVVCNLFSDDEISEITGFDVIRAEGSTMGLPMCEWELSVPESANVSGFPLLSLVLLPESEFRFRVDPLADSLRDIDGPADELKLLFVGGGDTGMPAMVSFFGLKGNQGFSVAAGFEIWHDEATATSAMLDLTSKIVDRI